MLTGLLARGPRPPRRRLQLRRLLLRLVGLIVAPRLLHILAGLLALFFISLARAGQVEMWMDQLTRFLQAEVLHTVCAILAVYSFAGSGFLPAAARTILGYDSAHATVLAGVCAAAIGWGSLIAISEQHGLELIRPEWARQEGCWRLSRVHGAVWHDAGLRGARSPVCQQTQSLAESCLAFPIGLFRLMLQALARPWAAVTYGLVQLTVLLLPSTGGELNQVLDVLQPLGQLKSWGWWELREAAISLIVSLGSLHLGAMAISRAYPRLRLWRWFLGPGMPAADQELGPTVSGILTTVSALGVLWATAEPIVWFWTFLASPFRGRLLPRSSPPQSSWVPEEDMVAVLLLWLCLRFAFAAAYWRREQQRALVQVEETLRSAFSRPFQAELEPGFFSVELAGNPGLRRERPEAETPPSTAELRKAHLRLLMARRRELEAQALGPGLLHGQLAISVRRSSLLKGATKLLLERPVPELLAPVMNVNFEWEQGIDAGGLSRDWFDSVGRCLIKGAGASGLGPLVLGPDGTLEPRKIANLKSDRTLVSGSKVEQAMRTLLAIGRFLALALLRSQQLPLQMSPIFYKHVLLWPLSRADLQRLDSDFFKHRVQGLLGRGALADLNKVLPEPLAFVGVDGEDLLPQGSRLRVTEENKVEYLRLLCEAKCCGGKRVELRCLLEGFWDLLPLPLLRDNQMTPTVLAHLISGSGHPDPQDWQRHSRAIAGGVQGGAQIVAWFWDIVKKDLTNEQRAELLRFTTGSSRPPSGGFAELQPSFTIEVSGMWSPSFLPHASTCVNKLVLHCYSSRKQLLEKLLLGIASEGFGQL